MVECWDGAAAVSPASRGWTAVNGTCQAASTFSIPSSPLQHEVLVILLGHPQFERVLQQNLFRFEPHVLSVCELSDESTSHVTVLCSVLRHEARGHLFVSRSPPFPTSTGIAASDAKHCGIVVCERRGPRRGTGMNINCTKTEKRKKKQKRFTSYL